MEKLQKTIEVSKETYELAEGLANFVVAMKDSLSDGWQWGEDLTDAIGEAMEHLVPAVKGSDQIVQEYREAPAETINALVIPMANLLGRYMQD